jgi:hypothetical protein
MTQSKFWKFFLVISFILGLFLRTLYVEDMEYKEDERYNYTQSQEIGNTTPWPAYGIASGVYIVNPGMSIWVFAALAKVTGAKTPTQLARAVQIFALLGISLVLVFAFYFLEAEEREPWFWTFSLAMVNPFALLYQRKLWPEPFLPFFSMLMLMGWWKREKRWGAFTWGLIGALIGQIHMSGFFLAAGFFLWTLVFSSPEKRKLIQWRYWFLGSVLGSVPLIPWLTHLLTQPTRVGLEHGWNEAVQLKYWVYWMTDVFGIHFGTVLGTYTSDHFWGQLADFIRYPLIGGHATYILLLAHVGVLAVIGWITWILVRTFNPTLRPQSDIAMGQNAAWWLPGIFMTLMNLQIRRYYLQVVFPWDFIWLSRIALRRPTSGRRCLAMLWFFQLIISAGFVHYIHVHHGAPQGDYGDGYSIIHKP